MAKIVEGVCQECGELLEYFCTSADKDDRRTHQQIEESSSCMGEVKRRPFPSSFAVKWKYGKHDKTGCFMGPSKNIYKTDTTEKSRISKTRTVFGNSYTGKANKA